MTVSVPLVFPASRALAGWWRQLAPWQPRSWWDGHLLLHHIEALAVLVRPARPDPLHRLVLHALTLTPGCSLEQLDDRLRLGRQLLGRLLRTLQGEGLASSDAGGAWSVTEAGRQAAAQGEWPRTVYERRSFRFVDSESPEQPPHFLNLNEPPGLPWSGGDDWRFDAGLLSAAVAQSEEWKRRFGFPLDVRHVLTMSDGAEGPPPWQRVIVDRPERLPIVVVQSETGHWLGFLVRQDSWTLQSETPLFSLEEGGPEVFSWLTAGLSLDAWQQAWRAWCQPRGLAGLGTETCPVELDGYRLRVQVPPRLMERLRATRSDALKGEAWILGGNGRLRPAALLEIIEEGAKGTAR